jgi:hypothetical protein
MRKGKRKVCPILGEIADDLVAKQEIRDLADNINRRLVMASKNKVVDVDDDVHTFMSGVRAETRSGK